MGLVALFGEANPMAAFLIDMEIERDIGFTEGERELQGVFHGDGWIFFGAPNETGRGVGSDLEFIGEAPHISRIWILAEEIALGSGVGEFAHRDDGVAEDTEIGAGRDAVDGIVGVGVARVEVGEEGRGQVSARRGAHDTDSRGIHMEFGRLGPDEAHGAGNVHEHDGVTIPRGAESVSQDECGDSLFVEPFGVAVAFVARESAITTAGADNDRRRGVTGLADQIGLDDGAIGFLVAQSARRVIFPERNRVPALTIEFHRVVHRNNESAQRNNAGRVASSSYLWHVLDVRQEAHKVKADFLEFSNPGAPTSGRVSRTRWKGSTWGRPQKAFRETRIGGKSVNFAGTFAGRFVMLWL